MNTERIIRMLWRTLMRRGLRKMILQKLDPVDNSSPEARQNQQRTRETQKRVSKAFRASRRFPKL